MRSVLSFILALAMVFSFASSSFAAEGPAPNISITTTVNGETVKTETVDGELVTTTTTNDDKAVTNAEADASEKGSALHGFAQEICASLNFGSEQSEAIKPQECKLIQALRDFIYDCVREFIKTHPNEVRKMLDEASGAELEVSAAEQTAPAAESAADAAESEAGTEVTAQEVSQ